MSQSLSSRAMSFDTAKSCGFTSVEVSIPFEQGDVFRQNGKADNILTGKSLNPFRAGRCLSTRRQTSRLNDEEGLNPFRAGRCLSTYYLHNGKKWAFSLNPFRAGRCLSTEISASDNLAAASQSLSSRAMSFDSLAN